MENLSNEKSEESGVKSVKIENNHFVVDVVWKDGYKSTSHFPVDGFEIVNKNGKRIGYMYGDCALDILKEYSSQYKFEDFSWIDFV